MVPGAVQTWLNANGWGQVVSEHPVGGGCINHGARLQTSSGRSAFLKTNRAAPPDMFAREAEGLQALRQPDGPRVPEPYCWGPDFLLLEDLTPSARQADYWPRFGRQLAALHAHANTRFGFERDNYIGSTPQSNRWTDDGYRFFGEQRLLFQANLAQRSGLLDRREVGWVEDLVKRLPELVPAQPPALLHGDLWSGNALTDEAGAPALIDPAAHWGWAEAELAMTALFGAFPDAFYRAYEEMRPLEPEYRERFPIYNLYHLLNHLNLFGEGYLGQVQMVLRRYR